MHGFDSAFNDTTPLREVVLSKPELFLGGCTALAFCANRGSPPAWTAAVLERHVFEECKVALEDAAETRRAYPMADLLSACGQALAAPCALGCHWAKMRIMNEAGLLSRELPYRRSHLA